VPEKPSAAASSATTDQLMHITDTKLQLDKIMQFIMDLNDILREMGTEAQDGQNTKQSTNSQQAKSKKRAG
jgi:uncharacterized membrane protein YjjP (DUF1212 family)